MNTALTVACVLCEAKPGEPCRDLRHGNKEVPWFHFVRMDAADEAAKSGGDQP